MDLNLILTIHRPLDGAGRRRGAACRAESSTGKDGGRAEESPCGVGGRSVSLSHRCAGGSHVGCSVRRGRRQAGSRRQGEGDGARPRHARLACAVVDRVRAPLATRCDPRGPPLSPRRPGRRSRRAGAAPARRPARAGRPAAALIARHLEPPPRRRAGSAPAQPRAGVLGARPGGPQSPRVHHAAEPVERRGAARRARTPGARARRAGRRGRAGRRAAGLPQRADRHRPRAGPARARLRALGGAALPQRARADRRRARGAPRGDVAVGERRIGGGRARGPCGRHDRRAAGVGRRRARAAGAGPARRHGARPRGGAPDRRRPLPAGRRPLVRELRRVAHEQRRSGSPAGASAPRSAAFARAPRRVSG